MTTMKRKTYTVDQVKIALRTIFSGTSFRKTSTLFEIPKSTLHNWTTRLGNMKYKYNGRKRSKYKQNSKLIEEIIHLVDENPFHTLASIQSSLSYRDLSIATIHRVIKRMGRSYKKISWRTPSRDITEEKIAFEQEYARLLDSGQHIVSIDETGFISKDLPLYGYGKKGEKLRIVKRPSKRFKLSSVVGITNYGDWFENTVDGNINGPRFQSFVGQMFPRLPPGSVVILDNIAFHKSNWVHQAASANDVRLLFTPPCSPEYNPIENLFSAFKANTRKRFVMTDFQNADDFRTAVLATIHSVSARQQFRRYFGI